MKKIISKTTVIKEEYQQALLEAEMSETEMQNKIHDTLVQVFAKQMFASDLLYLSMEEGEPKTGNTKPDENGITTVKPFETIDMKVTGYVMTEDEFFQLRKLGRDLSKTLIDDKQEKIVTKIKDILSNVVQ